MAVPGWLYWCLRTSTVYTHAACVITGSGRYHSIPTAQNCFTMDLDAELESGKVNLVFCILVLTTCVV